MFDLTAGEKLLLDRRRRGENQEQAAKRLGKTRSWIYQAENDIQEAPVVKLGKVKLHEKAVIARRRAGFTQEELGKRLGYSREWIKLMELGKIDGTPLFICWNLN